MQRWARVRPAVLLAAFAVILGVLAKAILAPVPLERPLPPFAFPKAAPIHGWDADVPEGDPSEASYGSARDGVSLEVRLRFIADLRLLHISDRDLMVRMLPAGDLPLDVGMHYLVDASGKIRANDKGAPPTSRRLEIIEETGFHGFWDDGGQLHLSALIGATGRTVATSRQLLFDIYLPQFGTARMAGWLLEGSPLPDKRCILADVSILAPGMPAAEARARLERAWSEWHGWCAPRFAGMCEATEGR